MTFGILAMTYSFDYTASGDKKKMNAYPKRLIDVDSPIKHSLLHIWWVWQPLAACWVLIGAVLWLNLKNCNIYIERCFTFV
jgi:hypothetical protein